MMMDRRIMKFNKHLFVYVKAPVLDYQMTQKLQLSTWLQLFKLIPRVNHLYPQLFKSSIF